MGFLGFLSGVIGTSVQAGTSVYTLLLWIIRVLLALFSLLWGILVTVANFLYGILKKVGGVFKFVWERFVKGVFTKLFNAILKAHDWLEQHLKPVIDFLKKVRAFYDRFFNHYIKPFLNLIQHIRRFLLVLRLLHIKWAAELDATLLKIETKVAGVFLQVRAALNGVIDLVNILADPTGLVRHPGVVIAIRRSLPAIVTSVTGKPISFFWPGADTNAMGGIGAIDPRISFNFLSEGTIPDDGDLTDLPPLDYFTTTYAECVTFGQGILHLRDLIEILEHDISEPSTITEKVSNVASDLFAQLIPTM